MKNLNKLQQLTFEFDDIELIECVGQKECIDIEVADESSFTLSNGIITHNSAISGISNALGRDGIGYFELRGVPMNAYEEKVLNILSNNELKTIIDILELDMTSDKKPDSDNWYSINIDNQEYIVNENDDILIDGYYYDVSDIIKNELTIIA